MKRAILIAGGTVGGLGAVLSVTPPQLSDNGLSTLAGASAATSLPASATHTPSVTPTTSVQESAANVVTTKPSASASKKATAKKTSSKNKTTNVSAATTAAAPTPTPVTTKSATTTGVSGSFTGDGINVGYGTVQVKITVSNGKITDAVAVSAPVGRNQRWSDFAVPNLRSQTLAAQSAAITGVSGASYTSYGWYKSLITALQKAGLPTGV